MTDNNCNCIGLLTALFQNFCAVEQQEGYSQWLNYPPKSGIKIGCNFPPVLGSGSPPTF